MLLILPLHCLDQSNEQTWECTGRTHARGIGGEVVGSCKSGAKFSLVASLSTSSLPDILTCLVFGVRSRIIRMMMVAMGSRYVMAPVHLSGVGVSSWQQRGRRGCNFGEFEGIFLCFWLVVAWNRDCGMPGVSFSSGRGEVEITHLCPILLLLSLLPLLLFPASHHLSWPPPSNNTWCGSMHWCWLKHKRVGCNIDTIGANTVKTCETVVKGHGTHMGSKSGHCTCTRDLKTMYLCYTLVIWFNNSFFK